MVTESESESKSESERELSLFIFYSIHSVHLDHCRVQLERTGLRGLEDAIVGHL